MSDRINLTFDELYENVNDDETLNISDFQSKLNDLLELEFIERGILEDHSFYYAKQGLSWNDFLHWNDIIKKNILLELIPNPITSFILLNTQQGKLKQSANKIKDWITFGKVVTFVIVANDKTLSDQTSEGIEKTIGRLNIRLFSLSSNSKITLDEIKMYIDAFEGDTFDEYIPPVIVLLANNIQCIKMLKLQAHITRKIMLNSSKLRFANLFDEADVVYKKLRNYTIDYQGNQISLLYFNTVNNIGLIGLCFVTATDGDLLDDYPECSNAYLNKVHLSESDVLNYRGFHTVDSIIHRSSHISKNQNNKYALEIIKDNYSHFTQKLSNGNFRNTIIHSNASTNSMEKLAIDLDKLVGANSIIFNGKHSTSIKVYKDGKLIATVKTRNKKFNEMLMYVYTRFDLNDSPLFIIGRRKVDRGLGFHFPNRENKIISGLYGDITVSENDGLIWTDMILGRIEDKKSAVQKAGRLSGIIASHPNYHGNIDYWTDNDTADLIYRHNCIIDKVNLTRGYTAGQAIFRASEEIPEITTDMYPDWELYPGIFDNLEDANIFIQSYGGRRRNDNFTRYTLNYCENKNIPFEPAFENFILSSTTGNLCILNFNETLISMEGWVKTSTLDVNLSARIGQVYSRIYVCYEENTVKLIVRILKRER